jgi:outer membrane biogenesis lipoprotein LolB
MSSLISKRSLLAIVAMALSACVTVPNLPELISKPTIHTGRFAVSYQKDNIAQREQGGFEWKIQNQAERDKAMQLTLLSPLGTSVALIALDPQTSAERRASLTTPLNTDYAPTLDLLMQRTLGWGLPLNELIAWLGKDEPTGMPTNWRITVLSRYSSGLPKLMTAENTALQISVRLIFEE